MVTNKEVRAEGASYNWLCRLVMETGCADWLWRLAVPTGYGDWLCRLVMETGCADWLWRLVVPVSYTHLTLPTTAEV